jgi:hypothetical protein
MTPEQLSARLWRFAAWVYKGLGALRGNLQY